MKVEVLAHLLDIVQAGKAVKRFVDGRSFNENSDYDGSGRRCTQNLLIKSRRDLVSITQAK